MNTMDHFISWALPTLVGAFVGSYFAGYLRKKGENLATHEDIDKLVAQVAAVTTTTKEIEAKITSDVWDRQKRWELRREVLFEAARRVSEVDVALLYISAVLKVERPDQKDDPERVQARSDGLKKWNRAATA